MNVEHRHNHNYRNDPREAISIPGGVLAKDVEETLNKIQQSYRELLHDRLIEDVTDGISLDTPIYRIDSLAHFKEALHTNKLYLANPCNWDDPWESFILRERAWLQDGSQVDISAMKDSFFAQCWSRIPECEGLWKSRYYAPSNALSTSKNDKIHLHCVSRGRLVKIKTTVRLLMREVYKFDDIDRDAEFRIGAVRYKNVHDIKLMHENSFKDPSSTSQTRDIIDSLLTKRVGYEYEGEVRLICFNDFVKKSNSRKVRDHIMLPNINFRRFASEIEIDPWCSYEEFIRIKAELENKYKIFCVEQSSLMRGTLTPTILFGKDCLVVTPTRIIAPKT